MKTNKTLIVVDLFKKMAETYKPFELFESHLWKDKIGDSKWHCDIRSCDAILTKGLGETMEEAIIDCYNKFNPVNQ